MKTFTVRGILPPGGVGRAFGGNLLLIDVVGAQVVLGREGRIDQVDVTLAPDGRRRVRGPRHRRRPAAGARGGAARRGAASRSSASCARTALCSPGCLGLALLAAVFVVDRHRRHRRRGAPAASSDSCAASEPSDGTCCRLIVSEAALLGVLGTAIGIPLGLLLARLLVDSVAESTALVLSLQRFARTLDVPPYVLALGAVTGLGTTLAAALLPARAAAGITPLAAVRTPAQASGGRRWPAPGVLPGALLLVGAGLAAQVRFDAGWGGNLAALAADVALVCAFMRVAGGASARLLAPLGARLGIAGRLAADRLTRLPDQLALAGGVLALGLGLMLMAGTLARSFEESVLDFVRRQVRADLVVSSTSTTGWIETPVPESVGARLAAVPGVARVERLRLAEQDFRGQRISVDSLDASAFGPERRDDFRFAAGDPDAALAAVRTGDAVLVSRNFARSFGVASATGSTSTRLPAASRPSLRASSWTTCRRAAA